MRTPYNLPSFYKGQLVTVADGTNLRHVYGWRRVTHAEYLAWRASPASQGHDDAGESHLPPKDTHITLVPGRPYEVLRGRVAAAQGYGNPRSGCMELQCFTTGERFYAYRESFKTFQ
jgi:hypothetical protein